MSTPWWIRLASRRSGLPVCVAERPRADWTASVVLPRACNARKLGPATPTPPHDAPQKAASPLDFFHKSATSIVGTDETVVLPDIPEATVFQPEPELAYVMGRPAKDVSEADALNYVFGYLNFVDISARGIPNRR